MNNKTPATMTQEEINRLVEFFMLLYEIDQEQKKKQVLYQKIAFALFSIIDLHKSDTIAI